ncbi:RWD-domain-containing protein [Armillaria mellea]|nr:RWD-domain-containing protein [Armillaria mellea]
MSSDVLLEEFEVLESIYPTELTKLSETDIQIDAEPDDIAEGAEPLKLSLRVHYGASYPDVLPDLSLEAVEGELENEEVVKLISELNDIGEENLGMAMTFTLVSHLREQLSTLVRSRADKRRKEVLEKERLALEAWKDKFDAQQDRKKQREEEERMKGLTPKEREEVKRMYSRLSGRQLFEKNRNLEEDALLEEGTVSVDVSQYERSHRDDDQDEDERVTFSDSD